MRLLLLEDHRGDTGEVALAFGLTAGMVAMVSAMGQIERGANRIYGIRRDRAASSKYGRAGVLALVAGLPTLAGFVLVVGGPAVSESLQRAYGWESPVEAVWSVLYWPFAVALTLTGITLLLRHLPYRRQPSLPWLLPGAILSTLLWLALSAMLAAYVNSALSFSEIYGALAAMVALLLWANASGVALLLGFACCAQLEAYRAGQGRPLLKPNAEYGLWSGGP
ncbi:YihY/virulence factor BrkB family protein [Paractinoplanes rishiriensis]|uniref:YihY/virulence factor BrkB family protein n=1 Tax=Paractinoplanes rishiriensis TaxID=1050105 RepID=UPI0019414838|nr:YhjD/YihY/BrkB family envelope integrity protein [Actinoplanes rishiriensis]